MKVLELKSVNKIYNSAEVKVHAVKDVSLGFEEAEFAAIVGPSGSGKTTLLNLIGGLDMPTSGEITIGGVNLSGLKSSELIDFRLNNIGFVFQSYNLIPVLTAKENVEFIMTLQKWPREKSEQRLRESVREQTRRTEGRFTRGRRLLRFRSTRPRLARVSSPFAWIPISPPGSVSSRARSHTGSRGMASMHTSREDQGDWFFGWTSEDRATHSLGNSIRSVRAHPSSPACMSLPAIRGGVPSSRRTRRAASG